MWWEHPCLHHVSLILLHPESSEQEARSWGLHFAIREMSGKKETDSYCLTSKKKKNSLLSAFTMLLLPLCFSGCRSRCSAIEKSVESSISRFNATERQGQLLNPGQPAGLSALGKESCLKSYFLSCSIKWTYIICGFWGICSWELGKQHAWCP